MSPGVETTQQNAGKLDLYAGTHENSPNTQGSNKKFKKLEIRKLI